MVLGSVFFWIGALLVFALPAPAGAELAVRVRSGGSVSAVPLEQYVARVVTGEIYPDWPEEALKAQAVVARTYALHERARRQDERFDVDTTVLTQKLGRAAHPAAKKAAASTRGLYLAFDEAPILAAFHAAAGGRTASAREVWGRDVPYLVSVPSPDDQAPDHFWSFEIAWEDLRATLRGAGLEVAQDAEVALAERSQSGRVSQVRFGPHVVSGRDLRGLLGGRALRSALFELRREGPSVRFLGSGSGHGVGLSQWGARQLAVARKSFREILAHYYPGAELVELGGVAVSEGGPR